MGDEMIDKILGGEVGSRYGFGDDRWDGRVRHVWVLVVGVGCWEKLDRLPHPRATDAELRG